MIRYGSTPLHSLALGVVMGVALTQAVIGETHAEPARAVSRPGLVGVFIVWKRGWTYAEGINAGEA